jgi:hypothetical protein
MNERKYPLGIGPTIIPKGACMVVSIDHLMVVFMAQMLIIPDSVGSHFLVNDIRVNRESILAESKPGAAFSEFVKKEDRVKLKEKLGIQERGGKEVAIIVTNISDSDSEFRATFIGTSPSEWT